MEGVKVSVVVPVFNEAGTIAELLDRVIQLVVDDNIIEFSDMRDLIAGRLHAAGNHLGAILAPSTKTVFQRFETGPARASGVRLCACLATMSMGSHIGSPPW